jgi:uncharacterized protein YecT (DUF1311 family)
LFVSAACLSFPIASARAANPEATPTPDPVEEKVNALRDKAKSTADMAEAEDEGVKLWDKELNRVYGELLQQLPKEDKSPLKDSQQEWIRFRDRKLKLIQRQLKGWSRVKKLALIRKGSKQPTSMV